MHFLKSMVAALLLLLSVILSVSGGDKKPEGDITATLSLHLRINHDLHHVAISRDGTHMTVQEKIGTKQELLVIETTSKKILHRLPKADFNTVTFTPNGTRLLCLHRWHHGTSEQNHFFVTVYDVKTGKLVREIRLRGMPQSDWGGAQFGLPYAVADEVFVVAGANEVATVYSLKTGKILGNLPGAMRVQFLSISDDGRWLLTLDGKRNLRVWNVRKRKLEHLLYEYLRDVEAIAISPDGKWCGAILKGDRVEVFDRATAGMKASSSLGLSRAKGLAFTVDGKRLIARLSGGDTITWKGLFDYGLRIWEWQTGNEVQRVLAPRKPKDIDSSENLGSFYPRIMTGDGTRFLSYGGYTGLLLLDLRHPKSVPDRNKEEESKVQKR